MYMIDRTAIVLKPTAVFLDWLKETDDGSLPDLTLAQLRANCSVFLVPEFDEPEQAVAYFDERYREIFVAELSGWAVEETKWPKEISLENFWRFFELEVHDTVLDLEEAQWRADPVLDNMR